MTAHAQWKYYKSTDTFDSYIDYSRIKTEGGYKSIWELSDNKSPQTNYSGKKFKSAVTKYVIDCQASRSQIVAIFHYSEQMGKGEVLYSQSVLVAESDWKYSPPNSVGDSFVNIACATNNNPKPPVSNTQDNKRQRCINLGLAPNSADFKQCMN